MSIMVNALKIYYRTPNFMILKFGMQHWGLKLFKVCLNDDPGLTLTYFTLRSHMHSKWESHSMGKEQMIKLADLYF